MLNAKDLYCEVLADDKQRVVVEFIASTHPPTDVLAATIWGAIKVATGHDLPLNEVEPLAIEIIETGEVDLCGDAS